MSCIVSAVVSGSYISFNIPNFRDHQGTPDQVPPLLKAHVLSARNTICFVHLLGFDHHCHSTKDWCGACHGYSLLLATGFWASKAISILLGIGCMIIQQGFFMLCISWLASMWSIAIGMTIDWLVSHFLAKIEAR